MIDGEFILGLPEGMQKFSEKEQKFVPTDDFKAIEPDIWDFTQDNTGIIWSESKEGKKFIS
jgi:hypothetical protein